MSEASEKSDRDLFSGSRIRSGARASEMSPVSGMKGSVYSWKNYRSMWCWATSKVGPSVLKARHQNCSGLICLLPGMVFLPLSSADLMHSLRLSSNAPSPVALRRWISFWQRAPSYLSAELIESLLSASMTPHAFTVSFIEKVAIGRNDITFVWDIN